MSHDAFTDVSFPNEYPQNTVADHEVLMAFRNDSDAVAFREWWEEEGAVHFLDYVKRDYRRPV